jgi:cyclic-di-GMP phosphodiesterase TipF (flagellum assembly factor)
MIAVFFLVYAAIGLGGGYALWSQLSIDPIIAACAGTITTVFLLQIHLMLTRGKAEQEKLEARVDAVETAQKETASRADVLEARADALESTVNHELTERRDALVSEMRQLEDLIGKLTSKFDTRLTQAGSTQAVGPEDDAILRAVKTALYENRVDLHLQPIVSLPQRRVSFYEGFTRLRREDGSLIMPADFLDAARRAGLMGVIDNLMLYRSVEIVRRLTKRDRRVGVFCNVSASSLSDSQFFPVFLEHMKLNRDLAGALIFELQEEKFFNAPPQMRAAMRELSQLGFRFSLDHATSVNLDLPRLQEAGIRFVKVKGDDLIHQLSDPAGPRPQSHINRAIQGEEVSTVFSRYGVTLIAEKMEEEVSVVEILEYAVPYGQGHVFGAARPIKSSLMEETAPPPALVRRLTAGR